MSFFDYQTSKTIAAKDYPFYALIMAAARKADTHNMALLEQAWPDTIAELRLRYMSPGGVLGNEEVPEMYP